jgi:hypothetical protein
MCLKSHPRVLWTRLTDTTRPVMLTLMLMRVQGKTSKTTGNAGGRIACGVVGLAAA